MDTLWTAKVDKQCPLPEYPRPQMARKNWINLNGPWDYAINTSSKFPTSFDGVITVPFSPESELSGVGISLKKNEFLWYRREVKLPDSFAGKRLLLHFGAVDQTASVWVNNTLAVTHSGGYLPFSADITEAVTEDTFVITVRVTDITDNGSFTRGKQKTKKGGIWYTPQSGIWQTVWLEAVPDVYIKSIKVTPDFDNSLVSVSAELSAEAPAYAWFDGKYYQLPAEIPVTHFIPWTPETPKLYGLGVVCGDDAVQSYFAMRKFSVGTDDKGIKRLFLNNKPYFHNGVLDQGYWPDGLYTAPTDEAMIHDISTMKSMGFNMLRKHIKIEPLRWYYHCDRLGMLVWQDMPNGGGKYNTAVVTAPLFNGIHLKDDKYGLFARKDFEGRKAFISEVKDAVTLLYNTPCIAMWVLFNEGWGQFDSAKLLDIVRHLDPTRTIDHASGWHDQGISDVCSKHVYFKKYKFKADKYDRAVVLSEFGGYSHSVRGHRYSKKKFGYKEFEMPVQYEIGIEDLYKEEIFPAIEKGLSAAVYTQLSDVEEEINGLMTYDRKVNKLAPDVMNGIVHFQF